MRHLVRRSNRCTARLASLRRARSMRCVSAGGAASTTGAARSVAVPARRRDPHFRPRTLEACPVRLDAVPPKRILPSFSGTVPAPAGVFPPEPIGALADALPRVPGAMRTWGLAGCVGWSLLGLGERGRVDPRLISPSTTLTTYWDALRAGDDGTVE